MNQMKKLIYFNIGIGGNRVNGIETQANRRC